MHTLPRSFISNLQHHVGHEVKIRGWIFRIRELAKTTFILVKDCTGIVQCVGSTDILHASRLRGCGSNAGQMVGNQVYQAAEVLTVVRRNDAENDH